MNDNDVLQLGNCMPTKTRDNPNQGRVYSVNGLCPALNSMGGGGRQPMIVVCVAERSRTYRGQDARLEPRTDGLCNSITTVQKDNMVLEIDVGSKTGNEERIC